MARSARCTTCGKTIRPPAKDMSVGAAVRKHYWKNHREVMTAWRAEQRWDVDRDAGRRTGAKRVRR